MQGKIAKLAAAFAMLLALVLPVASITPASAAGLNCGSAVISTSSVSVPTAVDPGGGVLVNDFGTNAVTQIGGRQSVLTKPNFDNSMSVNASMTGRDLSGTGIDSLGVTPTDQLAGGASSANTQTTPSAGEPAAFAGDVMNNAISPTTATAADLNERVVSSTTGTCVTGAAMLGDNPVVFGKDSFGNAPANLNGTSTAGTSTKTIAVTVINGANASSTPSPVFSSFAGVMSGGLALTTASIGAVHDLTASIGSMTGQIAGFLAQCVTSTFGHAGANAAELSSTGTTTSSFGYTTS